MPGKQLAVSACMIVRNEEHFLEGCLASIRDVVHEIVVGDTGSTDRTPEIARDFGARLYHISWEDDFSTARNQILALAKGAWILSIDADERLHPISSSQIKFFLKDSSKIAHRVLMHPMTGWTGNWVVRLFRNDPRIRFKGIFHESLWENLQSVISTDNKTIGYSDLVLDHLGYDNDQSQKHIRNLPFLLKEIERDPNREHIWSHLGLVYDALGENDLAEKAWNQSIEIVREKGDGHIYGYIYSIEWRLRHAKPVTAMLNEAMAYCPDNPYLYWLKGRILMDATHYDEAIPFFERLILWGKKRDFNRLSMSYPTDIFHVKAYDSLATCHFRLGDYSQSKRYFRLAEKYAPEEVAYKVKKELCQALGRNSPPA
jgi:glycosyltransferase involved in cell wall biosynthesis